MKVSINEKYMLTVTESQECFGIGRKRISKLLQEHPEISIQYGKRWMLIRKEAEAFFSNLPIDEEGRRSLK